MRLASMPRDPNPWFKMEATVGYADLILGFGLARLGEADAAGFHGPAQGRGIRHKKQGGAHGVHELAQIEFEPPALRLGQVGGHLLPLPE